MLIQKYIKDLLYRYQCVTIPDFGSFLSQQRSARIDIQRNSFYPPTKYISFNEQLQENDGLLAKYISGISGVDYEYALTLISEAVRIWKKQLLEKEVWFEGIGYFCLNTEKKLQFQPEDTVNYLSDSYGLEPFTLHSIKRGTVAAFSQAKPSETKQTKLVSPSKRPPKHRMFRYAAVGLILLLVSVFLTLEYNNYQQTLQIVNQQKAQQIVAKKIQEATFDMGSLAVVTLPLTEEVLKYHVISGSFRIPSNAEKLLRELIQKGYDAKIKKNKYGFHRVSYTRTNSRREALKALRKIRRTENPGAWLLVMN